MKKQIIRVVVTAVAVILVAWHSPIGALITPEKTTSKNIQVEIYKAEAYTSALYTDASAKLQVTVVKVRGNRRSTVWQKNYDAKLLSQYPNAANAISQNITIPNVADNKEHLEVSYTLTYDSKGSVMQLQDGTVIAKGVKNGKLSINI